MILEFDAGNSRVKWRLLGGGGEVVHRGLSAGREFCLLGTAEGWQRPERVRAASVSGPEFAVQLKNDSMLLWGIEPEFANSSSDCAGVSSGYEVPSSLGVDRWMGILAAYNDCKVGCCVVDAGSALTFDVVSMAGRHLGGYIVPGMSLQRRKLEEATSIRLPEMLDWSSVQLGASTSSAVHNGILSMVMDWIVRESLDRGQMYLTGGDAQILSVLLDSRGIKHRVVPDLVLDGLAHALP